MRFIFLILIFSFTTFAQSTGSKYLPKVQSRASFKELPYGYSQKQLVKDYAPLYFRRMTKRHSHTLSKQIKFQWLLLTSSFLEHLELKSKPTYNNSVGFKNNSSDFYKLIRSDYGVCMGVTSAIRKINMLAHYDVDNIENQKVPSQQEHPEKWKLFYQNKIDSIFANKPVIIPGFANTREFTAKENSFHEYFLRHSLDQWALNNVTLQAGVLQMYSSVARSMNMKYRKKLHTKLQKRLDFGFNPKIYFSQKGSLLYPSKLKIHVVQVFKVTPINNEGSFEVHYWDPNFDFPDPLEFPEYTEDELAYKSGVAGIILFNKDGKVSTRKYSNISHLDLYKWDDAEITEIHENYLPFCNRHKERCFFR